MGAEITPELIRREAFARCVSVKRLARGAGIKYERAGRLLRGERRPQTGELERLASVLGLEVVDVHGVLPPESVRRPIESMETRGSSQREGDERAC